jgi:hypothetical protein
MTGPTVEPIMSRNATLQFIRRAVGSIKNTLAAADAARVEQAFEISTDTQH